MLVSRLYGLTAVILLSLPSVGASIFAAEPGLQRRDDPPPVSTTAAESATETPSTASSASNTESAEESTTAKSEASKTTTGLSSDSASASATAPASNQTLSDGIVVGPSATPITNSSIGNITNIPLIEGLPIKPDVTPALAVAGALLILSGAFYTLIGIKTKWLHIFLSTTYLFSLCVTVLIVYVMHPPISNAVQGGYLVAAAVTGLIFGAVAVIFSDVTEGLGCFLGGFCLGMWFLCLKPNGLIESQAGKSIFLGCFTVAVFGLYISHYTRPFGLIGSTSFAGATAVCLGVDMYSRAGLKEFWLYIWDLNEGIFPLNYNGPYPTTRGMRVELACTVLLCLLGVMSQMKVWNIVKQHREQKEAAQKRRDELRDQAEEELGRRVEADTDRDRAAWDAVYGKGKGSLTTDVRTSQASTRKGSMSVESTREMTGMEMQSLASAGSSLRKGVVTVHVAEEDPAALPSPTDAQSTHSKTSHSRDPSDQESRADAESTAATQSKSKGQKSYLDPKLTLKPKFVPLPFRIPGTSTQQDDDDKSSVATFAESVRSGDRPASRTKRLSGSNLLRTLSGRSKKSPILPTTSQEALVADAEDDRASSVAVALDGLSSHNISQEHFTVASESHKSDSTGFVTPQAVPSPGSEVIHESQLAYPTGQNTAAAKDSRAPANGAEPGETVLTGQGVESNRQAQPKATPTASSEAEPRMIPATLAGNLPDSNSKVVMAYRINEWAKHLDGAEAPVLEEVSSGRRSATPTKEMAAPLNVQDLQQTALTAAPVPISVPTHTSNTEKDKSVSPKTPIYSNNPYARSSPRLSPSASQTNLNQAIPRSPSETSLSSTNSNDGLRPPLPRARTSTSSLNRGLRSSSTPLISSPLAESIDENAEASFQPRFTPSPMHLLSQRENTVQTRPSSTSLLSRNSTGPQRSFSANPSLVSIYENGDPLLNDDYIPLAQRQSILRNSQSQSTLLSPQRSSTNLTSGASTPLNLSRNTSRLSLAQSFSPNTSRSSTLSPTQRDSTITSWRTSLANDSAHASAAHAAEIEQHRLEMMQEKQAGRQSRALERMQEQARRSVLDREMARRGSGMMDAHREAMRKMQGGVNEKLRSQGA